MLLQNCLIVLHPNVGTRQNLHVSQECKAIKALKRALLLAIKLCHQMPSWSNSIQEMYKVCKYSLPNTQFKFVQQVNHQHSIVIKSESTKESLQMYSRIVVSLWHRLQNYCKISPKLESMTLASICTPPLCWKYHNHVCI